MEFPSFLEKHCDNSLCNRLDFLPMKCDACAKMFCKDHITYNLHNCPSAYKKDVQVPVCPLCNRPVAVSRGELPDIKVGQHIDRDCQSDPAKAKRTVYTKSCSLKGCKQKEMVPLICSYDMLYFLCSCCRQNFCLKHRHTVDHNCSGFQGSGSRISDAGLAAVQRQKAQTTAQKKHASSKPAQTAASVSKVQAQMTEDEALSMALQLSINDHAGGNSSTREITQEESDRLFAQALQESERNTRNQPRNKTQSSGSSKNCVVT